ncbi:MAG TPA: hypothetical protein VHC97_04305 [Thermoanaerobaculia bacterium]|jgi:hypothetical protein|nr:hypothetical protein [Thermoanaerobaculia bacterium]
MTEENHPKREEEIITTKNAFNVHRQMVVWLFIATTLSCLILSIALYAMYVSGKGVTALMVVVAAGALGGFVSALRRLYAFGRIFPSEAFTVWLRKANLYVAIYSMIPPLVGAIGAVVLYLIFASGMISGELFPNFHCSVGKDMCNDFVGFVSDWQPQSASDYAMAFVWSFVAGFSERFVPDILERVGSHPGAQHEKA